MLFLPLLILGIVLYVIGKRVSATLIFFFFMTNGFGGNTETIFDMQFLPLKGVDVALVYVFVLIGYGLWRYEDFIPRSRATTLIFSYTVFLFLLVSISIFYYKIPLNDIVRTARAFLLIYAYFPFRRMTDEQVNKTLVVIWWITLVMSFIYIVQALIDVQLLWRSQSGAGWFIFARYYNSPMLLSFAAFLSFSKTIPIQSLYRKIGLVIFTLAVVAMCARTALAGYCAVVLLGWLMPYINLRRFLFIGIPIIVLAIAAFGIVIMQSGGRTANDLQAISEGNVEEAVDAEATAEFVIEDGSTLMFRLALTYERYLDIISEPQSFVLGKGLSAEGSEYTRSHFNYYLGLPMPDTGEIMQVYSPDIAWMSLIMRYGIVGTVLYSVWFFILIWGFRRKCLPFFLYGIILLFNSLAGASLYLMIPFVPLFVFFDYGVTATPPNGATDTSERSCRQGC